MRWVVPGETVQISVDVLSGSVDTFSIRGLLRYAWRILQYPIILLGLLVKDQRFPFVPSARRFFDANPLDALSLITRL